MKEVTLTGRAKQLRRQHTPTEAKVWCFLRSRRFQDLKFRRQYVIGNYIVDFVCLEKMLIIELDGGQHNEDKQYHYDERRTKYLQNLGYRVLRFWNRDILMEFDVVMEHIYYVVFHELDSPSSALSGTFSLKGEGPQKSSAKASSLRKKGG